MTTTAHPPIAAGPAAAPLRSAPTSGAIAVALADLARLDLTAALEIYPGATFSTHRCTVRGADGRIAGRSTGKGHGAQSVASALFEVIENYFGAADQNRLSRQPEQVAVRPARDIGQQPLLQQDLVIQRLAQQQPGVPVGCQRMHDLADPDQQVWYPLMLTDPGYQLHPLPGDTLAADLTLRRYKTTSGAAAGLTWDEAVAHALCEWVEQDAFSHTLLRWFVTREAKPEVVDPATLPAGLAQLHAQIRELLGVDVALVDSTTDLAMPSFFAVPFEPCTPALLWGAGTAPDPQYAAERTLSELLQSATVYLADREHFRRSHERIAGRLAQWPILRTMGRCDLSELCAGAPPSYLPLRTSRIPAETPRAVVEHLHRTLTERGLPCLVSTISDDRVATQVVAVRVPGLERFGGQVVAGFPALPTGRGMALWRERVSPPGE